MHYYDQICAALEQLDMLSPDNVERLRALSESMWCDDMSGVMRPAVAEELRAWNRELRDIALSRGVLRIGEMF